MKNNLFYSTILLVNVFTSYSLLIKEDFDQVTSSMLTENFSDPIAGNGIIIAPEWILTTLPTNDINEITVLDQKYNVISKKFIDQFWLLRTNRFINQNSVQRWHQIKPLKENLKIFSDFSSNFSLTLNKPSLVGKVKIPQIQIDNIVPEEQVYLENEDRGRGLFLETPSEHLLCGQVLNENNVALLNTDINSQIDYHILWSALGLTENFPNILGGKGLIVAPEWILTTLSGGDINEIGISNQKYNLINKIRIGQLWLLQTDRVMNQYSVQQRLQLNIPLDSNITSQINYHILSAALGSEPNVSNNNSVPPFRSSTPLDNNQNQNNPWVIMVYINDEDAGNYYTSCAPTLNSLCQALKNSSNNTIIIAQTTIPEPGPDFDEDYFNQRTLELEPHLGYIEPNLVDKVRNAKGIVRFILRKQEGNLKVDTEQIGPFNMNLSNPRTIQEFLNYGKQYQGNKMFCLYAHGRGWRMISQDKTPLNTIDFAKGFQNTPLDILRMDSCRSQMTETLYEVAQQNPRINYAVGSQQITALDGAIETYERLIPLAGNYNNSLDYAKLQTQDKIDNINFNRAYTRTDQVNNENGLTYSTINLKQIPILKGLINDLAGYLLKYAYHDRAKVINWLKDIRQNGTWFDDASEIRKKLDRNDPRLAQDKDYYYDLFQIVDLIKVKASQDNGRFKEAIIECCNKIKELQPKVVLENNISRVNPFSSVPNGLSIDFSPAEKFDNKDFDESYRRLTFSDNGNSNWYKLLNLK